MASTHRPPASAEPRPASDTPLLLFFCSETSGRSRRAEGFIAQVLQRRRNHETFRLSRIEADERPDLVERFRVKQIPTLVVVDGGHVRGRLGMPRGCADIAALLGPWLR